MTTYAIGDIQGCFTAFQRLLERIQFDPTKDILWFTGDLVNRGSRSLEVLRFVKALGENHKTVLGNHDLHLLAVAYNATKKYPDDTLDAILSAPDREELINWLRHRPLLHVDEATDFVLVHAGLAPQWTLAQARLLAQEVEAVLRSDDPIFFLQHMYGNRPACWEDKLTGLERLRCIVNYFTRMRFCYADGRLLLTDKGQLSDCAADLMPWFDVPNRANAHIKIVFGHWAALGGKTDTTNVYPLDTGCVWGNGLTAMRLTDEKRIMVKCP